MLKYILSLIMALLIISNSFIASSNEKYRVYDHKLVYLETKKIVKGFHSYHQVLYKNGIRFKGTYKGFRYENGKRAQGTFDGKYYEKGILYTGLKTRIYYKKGVRGTGVYKGVYYAKGKRGTGLFLGTCYKNGKPLNGIYKNIHYIDGKKSTIDYEMIHKKLYHFGTLYTGLYEKRYYQLGVLGKGFYKGKYYEKGLLVTGFGHDGNLYKEGVKNTGLLKIGATYYNGQKRANELVYANRQYYYFEHGKLLTDEKLVNISITSPTQIKLTYHNEVDVKTFNELMVFVNGQAVAIQSKQRVHPYSIVLTMKSPLPIGYVTVQDDESKRSLYFGKIASVEVLTPEFVDMTSPTERLEMKVIDTNGIDVTAYYKEHILFTGEGIDENGWILQSDDTFRHRYRFTIVNEHHEPIYEEYEDHFLYATNQIQPLPNYLRASIISEYEDADSGFSLKAPLTISNQEKASYLLIEASNDSDASENNWSFQSMSPDVLTIDAYGQLMPNHPGIADVLVMNDTTAYAIEIVVE